MGFWSALTGKGTSQTMSRLTGAQNGWLENARKDLNSAYDPGLQALGAGTADAIRSAQGYNQEALSYLGQGANTAARSLSEGRDAGLGYLGRGIGHLSPYAQSGERANGMYENALGLRGAAGSDAARDAFRAGPGYDWRVSQATEAAARKASSLGVGGSGNTLSALATLGGHLADQEYGGWLDRLLGLGQRGQSAALGMAGLAGQQANMAYGAGQGIADVYRGWGRDAAQLQTGLGSQIGGWQDALGRNRNASWMGRGAALAGMDMQHSQMIAGNYNNAAQATAAGAQNIFGAGMGLLNSGLKAFSGGFGGLGSLGAGGGSTGTYIPY